MIALLLGITTFAFAASSPADADCSLHQASFQKAKEGLEALGEPVSFMGASVRVNLNANQTNDFCSGTYISDQGHILLASHCLEICQAGEGVDPKAEHPTLSCSGFINGVRSRVKVAFKSRCHPDADVSVELAKRSGKPIPTEYAHCGKAGDLAVIIAEKPPKDFSCLRLGSHEPGYKQKLYAMGQPEETYRSNTTQNSNGSETFVSVGERVSTSKCIDQGAAAGTLSQIFFGGANEPESERELPGSPEVTDYLSKRFIQTTVDIVSSSSGGSLSLADGSGEVVGVASRINKINSTSRECKGATYFEGLSRMEATAKDWDPTFDVSKLKCERHFNKGTSI